ncbi:MAG TPA: GNAT family N-acetyltransferase [Acidimicrobiia bacterium]|nr:GNAT family N-acetyltransferase [Acidimicrobiia bacterium]
MKVTARIAGIDDLETLVRLYRSLEEEMVGLHAMWPVADGLDEPIGDSFRQALSEPNTVLIIGEIDGYPFGFLMARVERLLAQADGEEVGAIRLIYVDHDAREVAVGEEMRETVLSMLRDRGLTKFDAHVLPGHRLAKNFFESGGFSARSIIMHHDDNRE